MKPILTFLILTLTLGNVSAQFTKLLDFYSPAHGSNPTGSLISDGTFLYGTTELGPGSTGTLFKILPDGTGYTRLRTFNSTNDGRNPDGSLVSDGTFLYGMTSVGGVNDVGTIFKIMPDGSLYEKILDFNTTGYPYGSLIYDGTFLYGMTSVGGANCLGVVFKLLPDGTGFVNLIDFDATSGGNPWGSLISDGTFLYGMTSKGGTYNCGTLFKIMPNGTEFTKLLDFDNTNNGAIPRGSLIFDGTFLYGMTVTGGANTMGTIFKIMPDGTGFAKLLDFDGANNGSSPWSSLISYGTFLYGMTYSGGANNGGTLFKIMPDGSGYEKLVDFDCPTQGCEPRGSLFSDGIFLYGTLYASGANYGGTLFKYQLSAFSGISDNKNTLAFSAFPNPVKDILTIRNPSSVSFDRIIITDLTGKKVREQTSNLTLIDVSQLPSGMYLLQIASEGKKSVSKFIKQ